MTTWTNPRTWTTGEIPTAALLNTHLRDNLVHLKEALGYTYDTYSPASDYSLTGSTDTGWTYVDSSNVSLSFTKNAGASDSIMLLAAEAVVAPSQVVGESYKYAFYGLNFGGSPISTTRGGWTAPALGAQNDAEGTASDHRMFFVYWANDLSAASYTMYLLWRMITDSSSNDIYVRSSDPVILHAIELPIS